MQRFGLALDLKDDEGLIEEYRRHHERVWPEVEASILGSGITSMEIYLVGHRLFMRIEAEDSFSFESKGAADAANAVVQRWEALMWGYQVALPEARPGEKWVRMERIFDLRRS